VELVVTDRTAKEVAVARALAHLTQAWRELEPYLVTMTPEQRKESLRAPLRLNEAGRAMAYAAEAFPRLRAACPSFDPALVVSRLEDAELIAPLANQAEALARLADDSRQRWLSEAYTSTLSLYRMSKAMAQEDPALQAVIQPLAEIFAARRRARAEADEGRPRPRPDQPEP
jgi:hypothetical protein